MSRVVSFSSLTIVLLTACQPSMPPAAVSNQPAVSSATTAVISTTIGTITVELFNAEAPQTVKNFTTLANQGFYTGTKFHRVINDFMVQAGDPLSKTPDKDRWGTGGPGYQFADEINNRKLVRGSLAMANAGPNTNGSQFFIVTTAATPWLDGKHTNFGQVIAGWEVLEKIAATPTDQADRPLTDVAITGLTIQ